MARDVAYEEEKKGSNQSPEHQNEELKDDLDLQA